MRRATLFLASFFTAFAGLAHAAQPDISAQRDHALALSTDGRVYSWGWDTAGQLGTGRSLYRASPAKIAGLPAVSQVQAGEYHVAAVDLAGNVWTWGGNSYGQLGEREPAQATRPGRVRGVQGAVQVTAGQTFTAALKADGTVWAWGSAVGNHVPAPVAGLQGIVSIRGGASHLIALKADGTVWAVGSNDYGQLGEGRQTWYRPTAEQVPGVSGIVKVSAGAYNSIALRSDGVVLAWGVNYSWYTDLPRLTPAPVPGLTQVVDVMGGFASYALRSDGTVFRWDNQYFPSPLAGFSSVTRFSSRFESNQAALRSDGTVWMNGINSHGQRGLGHTDLVPYSDVTVVPGLAGIVEVSQGTWFTLARNAAGEVFAWGSNLEGELALADVVMSSYPVRVPSLPSMEKIAAGISVSYALDATGAVWSWGSNFVGQLGDGTTTPRSIPRQLAGIANVTEVAAGCNFGLFRRTDGTVWFVGAFPESSASVPEPVLGLSNIVKVAAGCVNAYAIRSDGVVFAWGAGEKGAIGDGAVVSRAAPVQLTAFDSPVTAISAGDFHTLARTADGGVWSWGQSTHGQLGYGGINFTPQPVPTRVPGLPPTLGVAAGTSQSIARLADGRVFTWGRPSGETTGAPRLVPGAVENLAGIAKIAGGDFTSFAMGADGVVYGWGGSVQSAEIPMPVGDGLFAYRPTPVLLLRDGAQGNLDSGDWFLDLAPNVANSIPPALVPAVVPVASAVVGAAGVSLSASINFRLADYGKNVGTFILGLVPGTFLQQVQLSAAMSPERIAKAMKAGGPVLVQLTASGWSVVEGQLSAFSSGVVAANGASNSILNATPISALAGARFCIGYGESGAGMLSTRAVREVLTLDGAASAVGGLPCLLSGIYVGGPPTSIQGSAVTLTASVVGVNPAGSVQLKDRFSDLGPPLTLVAQNAAVAAASFTTSAFAPGVHSIGGRYSGGGLNAAADVGSPLLHTVSSLASGSSTAIAGPVSSTVGAQVTFTATVSGNNPSGAVQFRDGLANLGSPVPLFGSVAQVSVDALSLGGHSITASYQGDGSNASSSSNAIAHTVYAAITTRIALGSNANPVTEGNPATLTATVTGNAPSGSVAFRDRDAGLLGTAALSSGVASITLAGLAPGSHAIVAEYGGDGAGNQKVTSATLFQQVNVRAAPTTPNVFLASSVNPSMLGQAVTFTATLAGSSGPATGTAEFRADGVVITGCGSVAIVQAVARCTSNALAPGTRNVTAAYGGSGVYTASVSPVLAQEIQAGASLVGVSPASVEFGGQSINTTSPVRTIVVTNLSGASLTIGAIAAPPGFAVVTNGCASLAPAATCQLGVTFTPATSGEIAAMLTLSYAGGGPTGVLLRAAGERSLVTHYYRSILRRAPDAAGKDYWEAEAVRVAGLGANLTETWFAMSGSFFFSPEYAAFQRDDAGFVTDLYTTFFNRVPDAGGLAYWTGEIAKGLPREVVLAGFVFSAEFVAFTRAIFGDTVVRAEINTVVDFYRGLQSRLPDSGGFTFWVGKFRTAQCQGAQSVYRSVDEISGSFLNTTEYNNRGRSNAQFVGDLYNAFLRRGGDLDGVVYWIQQLDTGKKSREVVRTDFMTTPEFSARVAAVVGQGCAN